MIDLKVLANAEMKKTRDVILAFPWEDKKACAMWLAQTYYMVNHSTRLVALAGGYSPLDQNELHTRFVDHAKEERNHQLICISDLKAIGHRLDEFSCLHQAACLAQIQYYWIQHRGPTSLFGYILSLECLAVEFGPELYRRTSAAFGKNAANFLRVHSEDDVDHTEKAFQQLNAFSDTEKVQIQENLEISASLYRSMLDEIRCHVGERAIRKIA
jgi:hypothetical protein